MGIRDQPLLPFGGSLLSNRRGMALLRFGDAPMLVADDYATVLAEDRVSRLYAYPPRAPELKEVDVDPGKQAEYDRRSRRTSTFSTTAWSTTVGLRHRNRGGSRSYGIDATPDLAMRSGYVQPEGQLGSHILACGLCAAMDFRLFHRPICPKEKPSSLVLPSAAHFQLAVSVSFTLIALQITVRWMGTPRKTQKPVSVDRRRTDHRHLAVYGAGSSDQPVDRLQSL